MHAPLSIRQWTATLKDERLGDVETVDEAKGWATWVRPHNLPPPVTVRARPTTFYTHNFNGFFKRVREGDFRRLLEDLRGAKQMDPDVSIGSEILARPMDEEKTSTSRGTGARPAQIDTLGAPRALRSLDAPRALDDLGAPRALDDLGAPRAPRALRALDDLGWNLRHYQSPSRTRVQQ